MISRDLLDDFDDYWSDARAQQECRRPIDYSVSIDVSAAEVSTDLLSSEADDNV